MPQPFPFYETRGGFRTATFASGWNSGTPLAYAFGAVNNIFSIGSPDILLFSGQGRLNTIIPIGVSGGNGLSGVGVIVYDAAPATCGSGGPFFLSGHRFLGLLPSNSFIGAGTLGPPVPINFDAPFYSGLCVAVRSGCCSFSIAYTPELNPLFAG